MGSKIKRYALAALAALFVVGFAGEVAAQNVIKKQYPPICTDVQNLRTAVPAGFIPCDWYRCGTSASTPTYVTNTLGTPVIAQVKDYNSNLQLDISRLSSITASMPVTMRAAITASALYLYDGTDFEPWTGNATGEANIDIEMVDGADITVGAGNTSGNTPRLTLSSNDVIGLALQDDLTSDNDGRELAGYLDSTTQAAPFYVDDNTLGQDNEPIADVMAEQYDLLDDVCNASNQVDINIAAQGLTAVKVSKDASANATGNRIYVTSNVDQIGGTAVNTNGGNKDGGTQTVILADDDPAVTNLTDIEGLLTSDNDAKELADYYDSSSQLSPLYVDDNTLTMDNQPIGDVLAEIYELNNAIKTAIQIIDDWDAVHGSAVASDGPQVMGSARSSQATAVDNGDAARFTTNLYGEIVAAGYSWVTNTIGVTESDPLSEHHTETTPVDETDLTDNTTYYAYWDMDGYRNFTLQCNMNIETDSITATLECTVQDDGTAQGSCFYTDVTNDLTGAASVIDSDFIWIVDTPVMFKYCRLAYAVADEDGNDSDLTCFLKRGY